MLDNGLIVSLLDVDKGKSHERAKKGLPLAAFLGYHRLLVVPVISRSSDVSCSLTLTSLLQTEL